jgi:hypothetical protein
MLPTRTATMRPRAALLETESKSLSPNTSSVKVSKSIIYSTHGSARRTTEDKIARDAKLLTMKLQPKLHFS